MIIMIVRKRRDYIIWYKLDIAEGVDLEEEDDDDDLEKEEEQKKNTKTKSSKEKEKDKNKATIVDVRDEFFKMKLAATVKLQVHSADIAKKRHQPATKKKPIDDDDDEGNEHIIFRVGNSEKLHWAFDRRSQIEETILSDGERSELDGRLYELVIIRILFSDFICYLK